MKTQDVKKILEQVFDKNNYSISYDDGRINDSAPSFSVKGKQKPYAEGYEFRVTVRISIHGDGDIWDIVLNDIFMMQTTSNKDVFKHILLGYREYSLFPCPEQRLHAIEAEKDDACYY